MSDLFGKKLSGYAFSKEELVEFIDEASLSTYAGGGEVEKNPERDDFVELVFKRDKWHFRDSYTGFLKSRGMEVVRYNGRPVWSAMYGGGMLSSDKAFARRAFKVLKGALAAEDKGFESFRGPDSMQLGKWKYTYKQVGDVMEFSGEEEISYEGEKVFFHKIIGGLIKK